MYEDMQPGNSEPLDSLPDYVPSKEAPETNPELAEKYPLNIIAPKSHGFLNSCYANMDNKIKRQGDQFVMISEADAEARGISEGDQVRVFNDRGAFEVVAKVTEDVGSGLVVSSPGLLAAIEQGYRQRRIVRGFLRHGACPEGVRQPGAGRACKLI